ncbi:hypothetical protein QYE76_052950 [Lolium multiflorum]|uniref:CCHC-type domain-containing protein n=1 Tax=Lolium multiflorum TaxID=4521 RepID=A0AAD8SWA7_LOLMU|nr:hypothetical protein QYE76_052950 [Lolium multiflorum]
MSRPGYQNRSGGNPRTGGHHHNNNNFIHHNNNFNRAPTRAPANPNTNTAPRTGSNAVPVTPKDKSTINCYECGVVGHYSKECPRDSPRWPPTPLALLSSNAVGLVTVVLAGEYCGYRNDHCKRSSDSFVPSLRQLVLSIARTTPTRCRPSLALSLATGATPWPRPCSTSRPPSPSINRAPQPTTPSHILLLSLL